MRSILIAFAFATVATPAWAQMRPSAPDLSCSQARSLVASRGAVVLGTGPQTYGRFVADAGFCPRTQVTEPVWTRTADTAQCFIGYRCRDTDLDNGR